MTDIPPQPDMIAAFPNLFGHRWPARGLNEAIAKIDPPTLCTEYRTLRAQAPSRSSVGKRYFVDHRGVVSGSSASNRLEEHYAIALAGLGRRWPQPDGGWFCFLDYQVPLKARLKDARIGKIDLLAVTDVGRLMVVELKVESHGGGRSDAPPSALMEGLRYAAIVEANMEAIGGEVESRYGLKIAMMPPAVKVLAPEGWWRRWLGIHAAGDWGAAFMCLAKAVEELIGVSIDCSALEDVSIIYGLNGQPPKVAAIPTLRAVEFGKHGAFGPAVPSLSRDGSAPQLA